jgi:hypothetical protein
MKLAARICLALVLVCGVAALLLGLAFWSGHGWRFLPVHRALGLTLVAALCVLAVMAWSATARPVLPVLTIVYVLAVAALGLTQQRLLPGGAHWIVEVLHLATAGYAIGLGRKLAVAAGAFPSGGAAGT